MIFLACNLYSIFIDDIYYMQRREKERKSLYKLLYFLISSNNFNLKINRN